MAINRLFDRLRGGEFLLGLCNMYPASGIIESMCREWDFVWIDAQHGQISYDSARAAIVAAAATGIDTLLRVPGHEPGILGPMADLAPSAIMVPMVQTADQAGGVVEALRFPPLGDRSYGGRRAIDLYGRSYYRQRELMVVAQIETLESVENAPAIANTEGIDMLFFGPDDMKVRMDLPIDAAVTDHPRLREAMAQTAAAARDAGKLLGTVAATPRSLQMARDMGYQLIIGGSDVGFLRSGAAQKLGELREALGGEPKRGDGAGGVYGG